MALLKTCSHARGKSGSAKLRAWRACGCSWYARVDGEYRRLGPDYQAAHDEHERLTGTVVAAPSGRLFGAVADRWESVTEQQVKPGTMHGYRASLVHVREWMGTVDVGDVTPALLAEMEADLIRGGGMAPLYARNARTVAVMVLGHAVDADLIASVPRGRRRRAQPVRRRDGRRYLERAELEAVWATGDPAVPMFQFCVLTGLRANELLVLEQRDVDQKACVLRVRRGRDRYGTVGDLKTGSGRREVDLPPEALSLTGTGDPLWPMHYSSALDRWHSVLESAGLPICGLHALRHTNAAMRIALGQDLVYIADQLGHADPVVTMRAYGHLIERERRDASQLRTLIAGPESAIGARAPSRATRRRRATRRAQPG